MIKLHDAWHYLFANIFPEELLSLTKKAFQNGDNSVEGIISFVKKSFYNNQSIAEATEKDLDAWREVFNSYWSWCKIKKVIQKEWMYPGIKAITSKRKAIGIMVFLKIVPKGARFFENMNRCKNIKIISLKNGELLKIT